MIKKCPIWATRVQKKIFTKYATSKRLLESSEENLPDQMKRNVAEHLRILASTLRKYFPELDPDDSCIRNPFSYRAIEKSKASQKKNKINL